MSETQAIVDALKRELGGLASSADIILLNEWVAEPRLSNADAATALAHLTEAEQHFNNVQSAYRGLASTWLLAAFAGMGFVLTKDDPRLLVQMTAVAAATGIGVLWMLDQLAYLQLLNTSYDEARKWEKRYPALPQVRQSRKNLLPVGQLTAVFYLLLMVAPLLAGLLLHAPKEAGSLFCCSTSYLALAGFLLGLATIIPCFYTHRLVSVFGPGAQDEQSTWMKVWTAFLIGFAALAFLCFCSSVAIACLGPSHDPRCGVTASPTATVTATATAGSTASPSATPPPTDTASPSPTPTRIKVRHKKPKPQCPPCASDR